MNTSEPQTAPVFPVLDTLRAVGALAVLTTHTAFQSGDYLEHGVLGTLLSRLDVGVALFFVLSGFLLSRPWLRAAAEGRPGPGVARYYRNRVLRIVPVYLVAVVLALCFVTQETRVGAAEWLRSLMLLDIYLEPRLPQGLTQMWSLAVEVMFYAVLPLLARIGIGSTLDGRRVAALIATMVAISVGWHAGLAQQVAEHTDGLALSWLPGYLGWFAVGIALAFARVRADAGSRAPSLRRVQELGALPGVCWAAAGGLMLLSATPLAGPSLLFVASPAESVFKHVVYALIAGLIVVTGVFPGPDGRYVAVMSAGPLRHLGHISYGIFCIHLVVLHAVMAAFGFELFQAPGLAVWAITLTASLVGAEVLYRVLERPAMRFRTRGRPVGSPESSAADRQASGSTQATTTR